MVPCTVFGSKPTFSMMSISPHCGQPTLPMSEPSIQNAGHMPCPRGSFIRASMCPEDAVNLPEELSRADVYSQAPYQQLFPLFSFLAVITRWPWPSSAALAVPSVYHCRSWVFTLSPVSWTHFPPSTPLPAGPSKSSVKEASTDAGAAWTCGAATKAPATSRAAGATSRRVVRRHRAEFLVDIVVAPSVPRATAGGSPAPYLLWMATKYERVGGEEQG